MHARMIRSVVDHAVDHGTLRRSNPQGRMYCRTMHSRDRSPAEYKPRHSRLVRSGTRARRNHNFRDLYRDCGTRDRRSR
jgi:hypothetical protein